MGVGHLNRAIHFSPPSTRQIRQKRLRRNPIRLRMIPNHSKNSKEYLRTNKLDSRNLIFSNIQVDHQWLAQNISNPRKSQKDYANHYQSTFLHCIKKETTHTPAHNNNPDRSQKSLPTPVLIRRHRKLGLTENNNKLQLPLTLAATAIGRKSR